MHTKHLNLLVWILGLGILTFALSACPKKQVVKKTAQEEETKDEDEVFSEDLDIRGKDFLEDKNLEIIHFDYDSSDLSEEARKTLASNADYLKKHPQF